jgi:hypothetical protein
MGGIIIPFVQNPLGERLAPFIVTAGARVAVGMQSGAKNKNRFYFSVIPEINYGLTALNEVSAVGAAHRDARGIKSMSFGTEPRGRKDSDGFAVSRVIYLVRFQGITSTAVYFYHVFFEASKTSRGH